MTTDNLIKDEELWKVLAEFSKQKVGMAVEIIKLKRDRDSVIEKHQAEMVTMADKLAYTTNEKLDLASQTKQLQEEVKDVRQILERVWDISVPMDGVIGMTAAIATELELLRAELKKQRDMNATLFENSVARVVYDQVLATQDALMRELRDWRTGKIAGIEFVPIMFADLEKQLAEARAEVERLKKEMEGKRQLHQLTNDELADATTENVRLTAEVERLQSNDNWPEWEAHYKGKLQEANQDAFEQRARADKAEAGVERLREVIQTAIEWLELDDMTHSYADVYEFLRGAQGVKP